MKTFAKVFLLLFFAINSFFGLFGQGDLRVITGPAFDPGEGTIPSLLAEDDDFYYLLSADADGLININSDKSAAVLRVDQQLNLSKRIWINHQTGEEFSKLSPVAFYATGKGFILLCKKYSPIKRNIKSYLFLIAQDGTIKKVLSPGEIENISESDATFDFFNLHRIQHQSDSTYEYVFTTTTPYFLDLSERINFIIYDQNLNVTRTHLLDYPDDFIDYKIEEVLSSKAGLFFIRVEISNPFKYGELVHQLVVYDIHRDEFNTLELNFEDAMVKKSSIRFLNDRILGLSGYFVKGPHEEKPTGIFYYLFEASNGNLLKQKIYHFSHQDTEFINPKTYHSKSDYQHLKPAGIHLTSHNHVLLLFEYYWKSILLIRDQEGMMYDQPYYYANEIFMFHFDSENRLIQSVAFPKRQMSGSGEMLMGFKGFVSGDGFYLFYNDHPKNKNTYRADKLKTMKRNYVLMQGNYDLANGEFSKSVFEAVKRDVEILPSDMLFTESGNLLLLINSDSTQIISLDIN